MAVGPALTTGKLVFPLVRYTNVLGRFDAGTGAHPDLDLAPLGLGLSVSRRHAEVAFREGRFTIRDLGSRLGTHVNGEPLGSGEERDLADRDTVTIGPVTLRFDVEAPWPTGLTAEWEDEHPVAGASTTILSADPAVVLLGQLPEALRTGQLALHYQPQVRLATGAVESVEALIRWIHPAEGVVTPDAFVPNAEDSGFIRHLTTFAISHGAVQARAWRDAGRRIPVSVNVSARDLEDPTFADRVVGAVEAAGATPADLLLEVTETAVMADLTVTLDAMGRLREAGFRFAIDDFGAGESSLGYLSRLPVDEVKIDQAFARDLTDRNIAIVRSAITMGHDLGLEVVAEGVEDEATADRLRELECDKGQGWFFGVPVPADEIT